MTHGGGSICVHTHIRMTRGSRASSSETRACDVKAVGSEVYICMYMRVCVMTCPGEHENNNNVCVMTCPGGT